MNGKRIPEGSIGIFRSEVLPGQADCFGVSVEAVIDKNFCNEKINPLMKPL
jgi:hypothetical protein